MNLQTNNGSDTQLVLADIQKWINGSAEPSNRAKELIILLRKCSEMTISILHLNNEPAAQELADGLIKLRVSLNQRKTDLGLPSVNIFFGCLQALLRKQPSQLERLRTQLDIDLISLLMLVEKLIETKSVDPKTFKRFDLIINDLSQTIEQKFVNQKVLHTQIHNQIIDGHASVGIAVAGNLYATNEDPHTRIPEPYYSTEYCPYPGLRPFQAQLSNYFFGREEEIATIIKKMESPLLALLGPSGVGKSSLVHAGILPKLYTYYGQSILCSTFRVSTPDDILLRFSEFLADKTGQSSEYILEQLEQRDDALLGIFQSMRSDTCRRVFLVLDQFEELFVGDEPQQDSRRQCILDNLVYALTHQTKVFLTVILTMRENIFEHKDYTNRPELVNAIDTYRFRLNAPTHIQLRRIIEQPLEIFNRQYQQSLRFEDGLVDIIIQDFKGASVSLPLLQHMLRLLWLEKHSLSQVAYANLGKLEGAFERHANAIYNNFGDDEKHLINRILLSLVRLGIKDEYTRKQIQVDAIYPYGASSEQRDTIDRIIQQLANEQNRLVTEQRIQGFTYLELTHEIILKQWELLRSLIEVYRERIQLREELLPQAEQWRASEASVNYLYRGGVLLRAKAYIEDSKFDDECSSVIQACYEASKEYRNRVRLRWSVAVLILLIISVVGVFQFMKVQDQVAQEQQRAIEERERRLGVNLARNARQLIESDTENGDNLPLALAIAANRVTFPADDADYLLSVVAYRPGLAHHIPINGTYYVDAVLLPNSQYLVSTDCIKQSDSTCLQSQISLWDVLAGKKIQEAIWEGNISRLDLSPDSDAIQFDTKLCKDGDNCTLARITWRIDQWKEQGRQEYTASVLRADTTGRYLVIRDLEEDYIWDTVHGIEISRQNMYSYPFFSLSLNKTKSYLASGDDYYAYIWDTATGFEVNRLPISSMFGVSTYLSNSGDRLLTFACDGSGGASCSMWSVELWDTFGGSSLFRLSVPRIRDAAFSPNDKLVALAAEDGVVWIYDTTHGGEVYAFTGHTTEVERVMFSSDGSRLLSLSNESIRIWMLEDANLGSYQVSNDSVQKLANSSSGQYIHSLSTLGMFQVFDLLNHEQIVGKEEHPAGIYLGDGVVQSDYALVLTRQNTSLERSYTATHWSFSNSFNHWSKPVEVPLSDYSIHEQDPYTPLAISKDGRYLLAGGCFHYGSGGRCAGGHLYLWDIIQGQKIFDKGGDSEGDIAAPNHAVFSPDNKLIITADCEQGIMYLFSPCANGQLIVLDGKTGEERKRISAHRDWILSLAISNDGRKIASASYDGTIKIWELQVTGDLQLLYELEGDNQEIVGTTFSPDATLLVTASRGFDGTGELVVWDVTKAQRIRKLTQVGPSTNMPSLYSVTFGSKGDMVFSGMEDGTIYYWRIQDREELLDWICSSRTTLSLTPEQRQQYGVPDDLVLCP